MKTIVLDDDPTGTQSAYNVDVLLEFDTETIVDSLRSADSVYLQTNSRSMDEASARRLARRAHGQGLEAGRRLEEPIRFVLRGDSTLRGHVFAETDEFLGKYSVMVFVPAFPDGGRTTIDGLHLVRTGGRDIPAHQSEYARDPIFPFGTSALADYVKEKSGRTAVLVDLETVRGGRLASILAAAPPGVVVVPDAVTNDDIRTIAAQIQAAEDDGAKLVTRSAAPLASELAGVSSKNLMSDSAFGKPATILLVCGSHTAGARRQLARVQSLCVSCDIDTESALHDPQATGREAASTLRQQLENTGLAVVASERKRKSEHNTLWHGERIMASLTQTVSELRNEIDVLVSKGGITSAEMARHGLGAKRATVLGQILPGISVWKIRLESGKTILHIIVPGNVGDDDVLWRILTTVGNPGVIATR